MATSSPVSSINPSDVVLAYRRSYSSGTLSSPKPIPHREAQRMYRDGTVWPGDGGDGRASSKAGAGLQPRWS